jgi:hypothetical protein
MARAVHTRLARGGETLALEGYRDVMRALHRADKESLVRVRETVRHAGEAVQADARARVLARKPSAQKTAAGYKTRVRQSGIAVEQSLRKRSGLHPEWGAWQMRHALIPALVHNEDKTLALLEHALDQVAAEFNRGGEIQ